MTTTVSPGSSTSFTIGPFGTIRVTASPASTGTLEFTAGDLNDLRSDVSANLCNRVYGPFGTPGTVTITVGSGVVTYNVEYGEGAGMVAYSTNTTTGLNELDEASREAVEATYDGVYGDGQQTFTEDVYVISATATNPTKAGAGVIKSITCTEGSAVTLTIYDNTQSAAGRTVWTGSLSAGNVVNPVDAYFTNGIMCGYAGTAVFSIQTSEVFA